MDTKESSAYGAAHPSAEEETPHGCIAGVVYVGYMEIGEDGEEDETFEAVPCRRCADSR